jgi:threonine/homoserine/homoserine lactone efflux protein
MLIVGGSAALIAIAVYLAWLGVKSLRASRRARAQAKRAAARDGERRHAAHAEVHSAPGE